jgi:hypothetical protein
MLSELRGRFQKPFKFFVLGLIDAAKAPSGFLCKSTSLALSAHFMQAEAIVKTDFLWMSSEHPVLRTQRAAAQAHAEAEQSSRRPAWDRTTKAKPKSGLPNPPAPPPTSSRRQTEAVDATQDSSADEIRQMIQRVKVRRCSRNYYCT